MKKWLFLLGWGLLSGCTATKFVPENQFLYTGATLKLEANGKIPEQKSLQATLESNIRPKPNGSFLGMRLGLWFYYKAGEPKKKKGFRSFVKNKLGKKPVYLSDAKPEIIAKNLRALLINNGYFEANVIYQIEKKEKTASIRYTAKLITPPYRIRDISYQGIDTVFGSISPTVKKKTFLQTGDIHRLDNLNKEIDLTGKTIRDKGFYFFNNSYLIFKADSTVGERQVDLYLGLEEKVPAQAKRVYRLDTVNVINHYTLSRDTTLKAEYDTLRVKGFKYMERKHDFRPEIILRSINLAKDSLYNRSMQELTLRRLTDLGVFKFVNVKFETRRNSNLLRPNVYLTPFLKKSLRFEGRFASKSNNFVGPAVSFSFINRNFLKGAELFQWQVNSGYEVQVSGQTQGKALNSFELGTEASLAVPRFISPVRIAYSYSNYMPRTNFKVGARLQNRVNYFQINSFNAAYGYVWRETEKKSHELYPIDLTYFRRGKVSDVFQSNLNKDPFLQRSFENQFILGSRYSFTYNSQTGEQTERRKDNFFFNGNIDLSGNLASLIAGVTGRKATADQPVEILRSPYSQYSRIDANVRYYHNFDKNHQFAFRLITGAGFAYGNSFNLPYIKQFSAGGSNSIRAFRARSVGPGSFNIFQQQTDTLTTLTFIDQTGDVKLESTAEYRFGIISYLKGAVFADAGNIWLLRNDPSRPGAEFEWNTFLQQIALGAGAGLRLDVNYFVLRLDAAFPLRKPYLTDDNHWVFNRIDFTDPAWRKSNLILNVAIGYPF